MADRPDFPSKERANCPECGAKVPNDAPIVHTRGKEPRVECPSCGAWFFVRRTDGKNLKSHVEVKDITKKKIVPLRKAGRPISTEEFDAALTEILSEASGVDLLLIPGFYELASEHFNNEAIERAKAAREED